MAHTLQEELEQRQDEVIAELDRLNLQIETLLKEHTRAMHDSMAAESTRRMSA